MDLVLHPACAEVVRKNTWILSESKNAVEYEDDDDTNCSWWAWNGPLGIGKKTEGIVNQRKNWDHPKHGIVEINQNFEKSPDDRRRLLSFKLQWQTTSWCWNEKLTRSEMKILWNYR